jgi:hypothetical protein
MISNYFGLLPLPFSRRSQVIGVVKLVRTPFGVDIDYPHERGAR